MKKNEMDFQKKINDFVEQAKTKILEYINDSYNNNFKSAHLYYHKNNVENWKNGIEEKIKEETNKLIIVLKENIKEDKTIIKSKENNYKNNGKKLIKIDTQSNLINFTSKDIQDENKEMTRNFEKEAFNYMNNPNENLENETVSKFLKEVARISRIAYKEEKKLLKKMKEKYRNKKHFIENEKSRKEFSSWVKSFEKEKGKKEYENIIGQVKLFENPKNNDEEKYLTKLFYDLTIMYFHCDLAFPLVSIDFKKEDKFNSDKMIDFINTGSDRKVNFIILPSLFSNGNFLENGKAWVFTYHKDTFKFEDSVIESLNQLIDTKKEKEDDLITQKNDDLDVQISSEIKNGEKYAIVNSNINLFENTDCSIILYLINKRNNKYSTLRIKQNTTKIDIYHDIKKFEVVKSLYSSEKILEK